MDKDKLKALVGDLYNIVNELKEMFPGRHFTPDGHMVGSLGECLVANAYDLELLTASNKGYDAIAKYGTKVEIKATQAKSVAFRSEPEHAIVIKILPDGSFQEIYNGPGSLIWEQFSEKKLPSNGQFQISLTKLKLLQQGVGNKERIHKIS